MNRLTNLVLMVLVTALFASATLFGQDKEPRKSPKAKASQIIGIDTKVTFDFSRPGVKGRTIWGELVPWGYEPGNKYSNEKPFPWRGGERQSQHRQGLENVLHSSNLQYLVVDWRGPAMLLPVGPPKEAHRSIPRSGRGIATAINMRLAF